MKLGSRALPALVIFLALFFSFQVPVFAASAESIWGTSSESVTVGPTAEPEEFSEEFETSEDEAVKEKTGTGVPYDSRQVSMVSKEERVNFDPESKSKKIKKKGSDQLPGGRFKVSGNYRVGAAVSDEHQFFLNDANADLQERNFRYLFGERQNNTYDPAVYSKYLVNIDFSPVDKVNFYTQLVADPWSWVGTTGEQVVDCDICPPGVVQLRYNLKYFGAMNSTLNEIYRTNISDSIAFPLIKVEDGKLTSGTVVEGFDDYDGVPGNGHGLPFTIPQHDIDYEFRPVRKLWMDYNEDQWHFRAFAFADERQALTTDDPLELSNHKDYWQQSPWLYQYKPIQFFTDHSIKRGYYDDALSFLARDSEGNRLVLLRGASFEGDWGDTYFASTVASPYTPWEENVYESVVSDNVMGASRLKHMITPQWMVGGTHTFRTGLIDSSAADVTHVLGLDTSYELNKAWTLKAQAAHSNQEQDLLTDDFIRTDRDGDAYKALAIGKYDHRSGHKIFDGSTELKFAFTYMDADFNPNLSRYTNTRDDHFWGNHITFKEYTPDLEHFRVGDGVDVGRYVYHARWKEKIFKDRFQNLFDFRQVYRSETDQRMETVVRDEVTFKWSRKTTLKFLSRYHVLPKTQKGIEPFLANYYFLGYDDPSNLILENTAVEAGRNPSRWTVAGAIQHIWDKRFTTELFIERTNDIPDFPRGLLNGTFRNTSDVVDGLLIDRLTSFLYGQKTLEAAPPYNYFTITRQRLIYKPDERLTYILHAAQNGYEYYGGIDDNINHVGLSTNLEFNKKLSFFADYTFSHQVDIPKLISTGFNTAEDRQHHNVYFSMDYRIRPDQIFRAEYGVFGLGSNAPLISPYSTSSFSLPTIDTEHLLRVSLTGDF